MSFKHDRDGQKRKVDFTAASSSAQKSSVSETAASSVVSHTAWDNAEFGDDDRKRKFMRLMGGCKATPQTTSVIPPQADSKKLDGSKPSKPVDSKAIMSDTLAGAAVSNSVWNNVEFDNDDRKRKFLRLMGANKSSSQGIKNGAQQADTSQTESSSLTTADSGRKFQFDSSKVHADLEREFLTGMSRQLGRNRRACVGFQDESDKGQDSQVSVYPKKIIFSDETTDEGPQDSAPLKSAPEDASESKRVDCKGNHKSSGDEEDEDEQDCNEASTKQEKYAQFQYSYSSKYGQRQDRGRGSFQSRNDHRGHEATYNSSSTNSSRNASRSGSSNAYMQRNRPGFGN